MHSHALSTRDITFWTQHRMCQVVYCHWWSWKPTLDNAWSGYNRFFSFVQTNEQAYWDFCTNTACRKQQCQRGKQEITIRRMNNATLHFNTLILHPMDNEHWTVSRPICLSATIVFYRLKPNLHPNNNITVLQATQTNNADCNKSYLSLDIIIFQIVDLSQCNGMSIVAVLWGYGHITWPNSWPN